VLISVAVIVGWYALEALWFGDASRPVRERERQFERVTGAEKQRQGRETVEVSGGKPVSVPESKAAKRDGIVLENKYISTSWTNVGAALQSLRLRNYKAPYFRADSDERPVLTLLKDFEEGKYSDVIQSVTLISERSDGVVEKQTVATSNVVYEVVEESSDRLVFEGNLTPWLSVRKTITLEPEDYHYSVSLRFQNRGESDLRLSYQLRTAAGIERETIESRYLATAIGVGDSKKIDVSQVKPDSLKGGSKFNESTDILWAGVVSQYFVAMVWPENPEWIESVESELITNTDILEGRGRWRKGMIAPGREDERQKLARSNATAIIHSVEMGIPRNGVVEESYRFIAAPKLKDILDHYASGLNAALREGSMPWVTWLFSFGTLSFLTPIMVSILEFFYSIIPNYGVAILLLTLLVRGVLHPLTRSSQMSMHRMQQLQPKIKDLMSKYGDDRQKLAQEQMKLYKKYGVHPMSGCWPMFLQMPVFVALFTCLRTSVQLRQATFIPGWITDLSQADTVWHFPVHLPIVGNGLNILPFIMVGMWILNQQLMPSSGDPRAQKQQQIMKWMPVFFAVLFYNFASGLLLYITASSGIGAFEHWLIRKKAQSLELKPVEEQKKAKEKKQQARSRGKRKMTGKPGLWERLQSKIEEQEKQSRKVRSNKDKK
jgi:YidC/Oxa1 family membrane protein insertase